MLRRAWQNTMIGLARSAGLTRFVQASRLGAALARRYVAGATAEAALARAARLSGEQAIRGSLFCLGEYVSDPATIETTVLENCRSSRSRRFAARRARLGRSDANRAHARSRSRPPQCVHGRRSDAATPKDPPRVRAMMLDMEDPSFTDATIALHDELCAAGLPVALTLQAYLRRTEADLSRQIACGAHVRLVKGAFVADVATSFTRRDEIKANSRRLIDLIFARRARGRLLSVDRHPRRSAERYAADRAAENGWPGDAWEIEMLIGVRDKLAASLAASGRRVRLYLPFGRDWWPTPSAASARTPETRRCWRAH